MSRIKIVNNRADIKTSETYFENITSNTIFSFGRFAVTTNFDGKKNVDYSNVLSSFSKPITLTTLNLNDEQSNIYKNKDKQLKLNLDNSNLNTFIRYGSAYEYLRFCIENIIMTYPGSLYIEAKSNYPTYTNFTYDSITDTANFDIPTINSISYDSNNNPIIDTNITNDFGLIFWRDENKIADYENNKNISKTYESYVIWSTHDDNNYEIIDFVGKTNNDNFINVTTRGNPFNFLESSADGRGRVSFHIKPNNNIFEEFRVKLDNYQRYMVSSRDENGNFKFTIKTPNLIEDGSIKYSDLNLKWVVSDGYNIDFKTSSYRSFLESILTIGMRYDAIKTDLIARFLTPASIKTYDFTEEGKVEKLLRIYGYEFDQIRKFIDSLVHVNTLTYDKINNAPDQLIQSLSKTFGWDYDVLLSEDELMESIFNIDDKERDLSKDLMPDEINIELWRRILINTKYYWKTKGTREALTSIFRLIGIPDSFINITEYVYTVDGKINPDDVELTLEDFPSASLPYDKYGYPEAPIETNDFYFQTSGDSDNGQAYLDVFRIAGFDLKKQIDNKKSWAYEETAHREHHTTPKYYQESSRLVLNTKQINISLDAARAVEDDVFTYLKEIDYPINDKGYAFPISFINLSLNVTNNTNTFNLPSTYNKFGQLEVRLNGVLLNSPREYIGGTGHTSIVDEISEADYTVNEINKTFTLKQNIFNNPNKRDVLQVSFMNSNDNTGIIDAGGITFVSGDTNLIKDVTINYVVARVKQGVMGTTLELPFTPNGDIQITINGIALTRGSTQHAADYIVNPNNNREVVIQNQSVINYLINEPYIQIAYLHVNGSDNINMKNEVLRIDSFNTNKIYFNSSINKYVYRLNYKVNNVDNVKILINGIALEPKKDYTLNTNNPFEIILPKNIKYGMVISVYYMVSNTNDLYNPIIFNSFDLGDYTNLSYIEFIDLIQRKLINVRNRKTVTNHKGGWYPTLLYIYNEYISRSKTDNENLKSNGLKVNQLYDFISKYDTHFTKFMTHLLPATSIVEGGGGIVIRNSVFTRQKFTYKRGVSLKGLNWHGNDGSEFRIIQEG